MKIKKYKDFNSLDIRNYWCRKWGEKYKEEYQFPIWRGQELSLLKTLSENYGVYSVLLGICFLLRSSYKPSIIFFSDHFLEYQSNFPNSKVEFFTLEFGGEKQRKQLQEARIFDAQWFPDPKSNKIKEALLKDISDWIDVKFGE